MYVQDFHTINWRNTLENPTNHLWSWKNSYGERERERERERAKRFWILTLMCWCEWRVIVRLYCFTYCTLLWIFIQVSGGSDRSGSCKEWSHNYTGYSASFHYPSLATVDCSVIICLMTYGGACGNSEQHQGLWQQFLQGPEVPSCCFQVQEESGLS